MPHMIRIEWPHNALPDTPPPLSLSECRGRLMALRAAAAMRGYGALVIYGDREHFANIHWLTGFDPRFEEAVLVVTPDSAVLMTGNECLPYTQISPLVQAGEVTPVLCASLSLMSQPRGSARLDDLLAAALPKAARLGVIGWKWFGPDEVTDPASTLDVPAFLADPLRALSERAENATDLMMHPGYGLRARVDAAEIARLEFSNALAAAALHRMIFAFREGMTDFAAYEAGHVAGLPLGCHPTFAVGTQLGLAGPTGLHLTRGAPMSFNICHWGSNICRAGWLASGPGDLPAPAEDYLEAFVGPYLQAMSLWCSMMRPGVCGGAVHQAMFAALPAEPFNLFLNPGHLIGMDEWLSSPIYAGSTEPIASGMAMQMDVIPSHAAYGSTRMEDGYVIADAALQSDLARDFPEVLARMQSRAHFMRSVIGLQVPDCLLPLSDTCGILAPWLLDPAQVMAL